MVNDNERKLSEGEKLIGVTIKGTDNDSVDNIKWAAANFVDAILANTDTVDDPAAQTFVDGAILDVVTAQMLAVKAATYNTEPVTPPATEETA